jgi:glutamate-ammonia-ligase adenylyltransferase
MYWRGRMDWHFRQVIADPDEEDGEGELVVGGEWLPLWEEAQDEEAACRQLQEGGFTDAPKRSKPWPACAAARNCARCSAWAVSASTRLSRVCWPRRWSTPTRTWCWSGCCRWSKPWRGVRPIWCC